MCRFTRVLAFLSFAVPLFAHAQTLVTEAMPYVTERVVSRDTGFLEIVNFRMGDRVKKDDIVGELDSDRQAYALEVAKLRANDKSAVKNALAEVKMNRAILDDTEQRRRRRQANDSQVSQAEAKLEQAESKLSAAELAEALAQLELKNAEKNLEKRRLRSPIDGIVTEILRKPGDLISAGSHVFSVTDLTKLKLSVNVPDAVAEKLKSGAEVIVRGMNSAIPIPAMLGGVTPVKGAKGQQSVDLLIDQSGSLIPPPTGGSQPPRYEVILPQE